MMQFYRTIVWLFLRSTVVLLIFFSKDLSAGQPQVAVLTSPADGATNVDPDCVFRWNSVAGAEAYDLWVGTSPGASDVVNSFLIPSTISSWTGIDLLLGQTLYVTFRTKLAGSGGRAAAPSRPWRFRPLPLPRTGHPPWFFPPTEQRTSTQDSRFNGAILITPESTGS